MAASSFVLAVVLLSFSLVSSPVHVAAGCSSIVAVSLNCSVVKTVAAPSPQCCSVLTSANAEGCFCDPTVMESLRTIGYAKNDVIYILGSCKIESLLVLGTPECGSAPTPAPAPLHSNTTGDAFAPGPGPTSLSRTTAGKKRGGGQLAVTAIVGISIASFVVAALAIGVMLCLRESCIDNPLASFIPPTSSGIHMAAYQRGSRTITIQDTQVKKWRLWAIRAATRNFSNDFLIGKGGYSSVYKAELGGVTLAVKRLAYAQILLQGQAEFVKEVMVVGSIHYRNLVALRGYCIEGKECLLLYDYMANGSLEDYLFGKNAGTPLSWEDVVQVLLGTASALAYLHEGCKHKIIHRDIKPANILLDEDFVPHVADFGLVRSTHAQETHVTTKIAGTLGYLAPEYAQTGQLSEKSDVYSFGVVVLVALSHRQAFEQNSPDRLPSVVEWAYKAAEEKDLLRLIAPHLKDTLDQDEALRFLSTAMICVQPGWHLRPSMTHVVQFLQGNMDIPSIDFSATRHWHVALPSVPRALSSTSDSQTHHWSHSSHTPR